MKHYENISANLNHSATVQGIINTKLVGGENNLMYLKAIYSPMAFKPEHDEDPAYRKAILLLEVSMDFEGENITVPIPIFALYHNSEKFGEHYLFEGNDGRIHDEGLSDVIDLEFEQLEQLADSFTRQNAQLNDILGLDFLD